MIPDFCKFCNFFAFSDVLQLHIIIFMEEPNDTRNLHFEHFSAVTPYLMWEEPMVQKSQTK